MKMRRTILSVPGNVEKMHKKAENSNADVIMFDLEDSVSINQKDVARELIVKSINEFDFSDKIISFRINICESGFAYRDILYVVENCENKIDSLVIPKVNDEKDIHFVDKLLSGIEQNLNLSKPISIEASIETAKGLMNIEKIAVSSERLISLVFGIADYSASVGAKNVSISGHGENEEQHYPGHRWHYPLSRIVMTAKANNLLAIDAPFGNFRDIEGLKKSASISRALGMSGKWAIHPDQIDIINQVFTPDDEEIMLAEKIIDAYEAANREGRGSVAVDGRMIDNATLNLAQITIEMTKSMR
jgi:malyl-CoA/(S)-citramalyl-CoA lyase